MGERSESEDIAELAAAAAQARANAHAPYSRFRVGAAIRAEDGAVYAGANVENAAYPLGQCAEASALGAMVAAGARRIRAILILAEGEAPCWPCGGCRQRLYEFAGPGTMVHVAGPEGLRHSLPLAELLPHAFGPETLPGSRRTR